MGRTLPKVNKIVEFKALDVKEIVSHIDLGIGFMCETKIIKSTQNTGVDEIM